MIRIIERTKERRGIRGQNDVVSCRAIRANGYKKNKFLIYSSAFTFPMEVHLTPQSAAHLLQKESLL